MRRIKMFSVITFWKCSHLVAVFFFFFLIKGRESLVEFYQKILFSFVFKVHRKVLESKMCSLDVKLSLKFALQCS